MGNSCTACANKDATIRQLVDQVEFTSANLRQAQKATLALERELVHLLLGVGLRGLGSHDLLVLGMKLRTKGVAETTG